MYFRRKPKQYKKMSLFVYGTLMLPQIRHALLGKVLKHEPGILSGYSAYTFYLDNHESEYPILKPEKGRVLNGYVLDGITKNDYSILKHYEGEDYHLNEIDVELNGKTIRTNIFLNVDGKTFRYCKKWSVENFVENHFQNYLDKIIPELLQEIR